MAKHRYSLLALLIALTVWAAACGSPSGTVVRAPTAQPASAEATVVPEAPSVISPPPGLVQARVLRVVDGDTIEVERILDGKATLRLIGVDAPETVAPGQPVGCFGPEASANTKQLLEGRTVLLEKDVSETDRYQRLLRYVYLEDGRMANEVIVRDGYAQVATFPPDVKYQAHLLTAQTEARSANRGLWAKSCSATCRDRSHAAASSTARSNFEGSSATTGTGFQPSDTSAIAAASQLRPELPSSLHPAVPTRSQLQGHPVQTL
jgi:micrococcal nuclease